MFKAWLNDLTEIKEIDWSADEHDPELIEDLWPVECWDCVNFCKYLRFFDKENICVLYPEAGIRGGHPFSHYRAIPRNQWTKWQEEKYNELRERYYGEE